MKIQKTFLKSVQVLGLFAVICLGSCKKPPVPPSPPAQLFHNVWVNGACNVTFKSGATNKVVSSSPLTVITYISKDRLVINGFGKVTVELADLDSLIVNGSSIVTNTAALNLDKAVIACNGLDSVLLALNMTDSVTIVVNGAGKYHFSGSTPKLNVIENGSSLYHGYDLVSQNCDVVVNGWNRTEVYVTNTLTAYMNGAGDVYYKGNPTTVNPVYNNGTGQLIPK